MIGQSKYRIVADDCPQLPINMHDPTCRGGLIAERIGELI